MTEKIKILYVDDEKNNLVSFQSYYRKEYDIRIAASVPEAIKVLEDAEMNIIISDQSMPEITGVEFLEQTIKIRPNAVRMLITGQSDLGVVIEAINRGQITKFVQKPWDWEKLSLAIENCALLYKSRAELREKNKELQKANDELNKFVYSLSHDLRSPLMSILGIVHLAKTNKDAFAEKNYFELIESCVLKLDSFIRNIIEYYKNSRGEEVNESIDFKQVGTSVFDLLKNQDQGMAFYSEIEQDTPFFGDVLRLKVILNNLVSNAIKYQNASAQNRFVKMEIKVLKNEAHISVSDNGIGIMEKHIENIFKLFFRTENSQDKDGTGIGLYIVKEALEKIGGTITVTSTPMVGSSFDLIIPNKMQAS
ncbi:MAG: hybrid sensor histidine kinase/response regulator [Bacteroidota bacterium]